MDAGGQGLAGGLVTMSFQFGAPIGLAVVTAVVTAATGSSGTPEAALDGFRTALIVPVVAGGTRRDSHSAGGARNAAAARAVQRGCA